MSVRKQNGAAFTELLFLQNEDSLPLVALKGMFMKIKISSLLFFTLIGLMAFMTLACTSKNAGNASDKPSGEVVSNCQFKMASPAPGRYENVAGTAIYSVAPDVTERLAALGAKSPGNIKAFFIILNPKAPGEAILVKAPSDVPQEAITSQSSSIVTVTGDVKPVSCPQLAAYVSENFGAALATTASGDLAYIEAENPIDFNLSASRSEAAAQQAERVELPVGDTPLGQQPASENAPQDAQPAAEPQSEAAAQPEAQNDAQAEQAAPAPAPVQEAADAANSAPPAEGAAEPQAYSEQAPAAAPTPVSGAKAAPSDGRPTPVTFH